MIKTRIIDNDMGHVAEVPLTGRGTTHGLQFSDGDHTLPEFPIGLLEMIAGDGGLGRFKSHATEHLGDPLVIQKFTKSYADYIEPILKSGKTRY